MFAISLIFSPVKDFTAAGRRWLDASDTIAEPMRRSSIMPNSIPTRPHPPLPSPACGPPIRHSSERCEARLREQLAASPVFSNLEEPELDGLLEAADIVRAGPGEVVFRRGDPGDHVLFILSGSVAAETETSAGRPVRLNQLKPGEIIGEMAVLRDTRRSATVRALETCEFLVIPQSEFLALLVGHPALAIQTLGSVIDRLGSLTTVVGTASALTA
jgi:hypothetical protein